MKENMPYKAIRRGNEVLIQKKQGGRIVGHSDSMDGAMKSIAARYASEAGQKMKNV